MKTRVLVVDDCPGNLRYLAQIIISEHIEIHFAQTEDDALRLMLNHKFAVALIKTKMPLMSGAELIRLFRGMKANHYVPMVLFHFDETHSISSLDSLSVGAVDILSVATDKETLKNKVDVFVRLDQQRLKIRDHEKTLDLMRDHFVAVVSHELRAPLSSVIGFAELLQEEDLAPSEYARISEAISRNAEMLLRLVDDILDFSRMQNGRLALNLRKIELRDFLTKIKMDLQRAAATKGLSLHIIMPENDYRIVADAVRMRQMLFNLLGNAVKFTEEGWVRMSVAVQPLSEPISSKVKLIFRIEDTGVGIRIESINRLFKPFGRADSGSNRTFGGTGLGLVISRQLARLMEGDLRLISTEPGKGSVFEVSMVAQVASRDSQNLPRA